MSARLTAQQNKIRLIFVFMFSLIVALVGWAFQGQFHGREGASVSNAETLDDSLFIGMRHVPAPEVRQVLPEASGKPAVLYFGSRLCHDCQRMSPVVLQVMAQHPEIFFKKLDVLEDQGKAPAIFRAFKPVSVPMVVLISPKGEIRNVLYDYQKPEVLTSAISSLQKQSLTGKTASSVSHAESQEKGEKGEHRKKAGPAPRK
jgi:thiol:disulfide interchange protein